MRPNFLLNPRFRGGEFRAPGVPRSNWQFIDQVGIGLGFIVQGLGFREYILIRILGVV